MYVYYRIFKSGVGDVLGEKKTYPTFESVCLIANKYNFLKSMFYHGLNEIQMNVNSIQLKMNKTTKNSNKVTMPNVK